MCLRSGIEYHLYLRLLRGKIRSGSDSNAADKSLANPAITASLDSQVEAKDVDPAIRAFMEKNYGNLPLSFEVNNGQVDDEVKYLVRGSGYTLFLTSGEAVLSLRRGDFKGEARHHGQKS